MGYGLAYAPGHCKEFKYWLPQQFSAFSGQRQKLLDCWLKLT
jgi:hypothetical protein